MVFIRFSWNSLNIMKLVSNPHDAFVFFSLSLHVVFSENKNPPFVWCHVLCCGKAWALLLQSGRFGTSEQTRRLTGEVLIRNKSHADQR